MSDVRLNLTLPDKANVTNPLPLPPRYLVVSVWRSILEFISVSVMLYS